MKPRRGAGAPAQRAERAAGPDSLLPLAELELRAGGGFPKLLRPSLTQRFLALLLEGLEGLLELRYTREREPLFRATNLTFEKLRFLARALKDRRALSLTQYEHFQRELNAVGAQLGGWRKACARRAGEARARRLVSSADGP
ncbi:MAG: four helix bundle protein [Planctomycetota bacterium]